MSERSSDDGFPVSARTCGYLGKHGCLTIQRKLPGPVELVALADPCETPGQHHGLT